MKSILLLPLFIVASLFSTAQVGIRTAKPTADLHIVSNPTPGVDNYNGVIIPKVKTLPVTGTSTYPKVEQAGLLIYLDAADATKGIYIFDGDKYIKLEPAAASGAFYNNNTTDFATTTSSDVFRTGTLSLGEVASPLPALANITSVATNDSKQTSLFVRNSNTNTSNISRGIQIENSANTTAEKRGLEITVSKAGTGTHIGIDNNVSDATNVTTNYGIKNVVGATDGRSSTAYGIYSQIGTGSSEGTNYAIYAYSNHAATTTDKSYSGYFRGDKFAIRSADDATGYDLPVTTGIAGQVLTTNGDKTASWTALAKTTRIVVKNQSDGISQRLNAGTDETDIAGGSTFLSIISFDYTPVYTSSTIVVEADFDYDNPSQTASGVDLFLANITVSGTEIMRKRQKFNAFVNSKGNNQHGGGNRSSSLTPIMGKYNNSGITTLSINVNFDSSGSDDNVRIYKYRTLKITEIPN